jgi:hypothetical protein
MKFKSKYNYKAIAGSKDDEYNLLYLEPETYICNTITRIGCNLKTFYRTIDILKCYCMSNGIVLRRADST